MPRKEHIYNLPNTLSFIRISAIPLILVLAAQGGKMWGLASAVVFALASITDFLDGYLARSRGQVTDLGRFLDPMADKLIVSATLIMLVQLGRCPAWVAFVIIGREIAVTGLRAAAAASAGNVVISAGWWGKIKVGFQIPAIICLLLYYPYYGLDMALLGTICLYIALVLTLWSGWVYFRQYWSLIIKG